MEVAIIIIVPKVIPTQSVTMIYGSQTFWMGRTDFPMENSFSE